MATSVFISYKWEDAAHNEWVKKLCDDLRAEYVDAKLDVYEVAPGASFVRYMAEKLRDADRVLFVVTQKAVEAVEAGIGGVAWELDTATAHKIKKKGRGYIIPILRSGDDTSSFLEGVRYLDFRDENEYEGKLSELVGWLHGRMGPPPLGVRWRSEREFREALESKGELEVDGWGPMVQNGGTGEIVLSNPSYGLKLSFTRRADSDHWQDIRAGHYSWRLKWDGSEGVIAVGRTGLSPK